MTLYNDYPKGELIVGAEAALRKYADAGIRAHVYFKATCPACGERPMFQQPDTCFANMECGCGHTFPFVKGNYLIEIEGGRVTVDGALDILAGGGDDASA
jgi:hypothetical protein